MNERRFREFTLQFGIIGPILQEGQWLVLDTKRGVLTLLEPAQAYPARIVKQELFAELETYALVELLAAYPSYCPLEAILAVKSGDTLEETRKRVEEARARGVMEKTITQEINDLV